MCRWGCPTTDTTHACKWCGTRFCLECHRGDFNGEMKVTKDATICRKCKQTGCVGPRVEYFPSKNNTNNKKPSKK
ncbi:hypothetical protein BpHYR1_045300 [Brachionus plicatilis]|uniref:Uncharacterized protein n=1 Tax=Brachionus plicatilis TaxID=10195 RepID=A0A3M7SN05_BRAPC|nr:hypothetical protein BpHYR1_045300 [Brachionus plicatilis]